MSRCHHILASDSSDGEMPGEMLAGGFPLLQWGHRVLLTMLVDECSHCSAENGEGGGM